MTENDRLKLVRESLGMTQVEFAEVLGMTQAGLSNVESGKVGANGRKVGVSAKIRNTLAKKYGISKAWLEDGVGTMLAKPKKVHPGDKDYIISLLEDKVRLLEARVAEQGKIIRILQGQNTDKLRTD